MITARLQASVQVDASGRRQPRNVDAQLLDVPFLKETGGPGDVLQLTAGGNSALEIAPIGSAQLRDLAAHLYELAKQIDARNAA
jgi:hypothetical protein